MKSKIVIDLDYKNQGILKIDHIKTDDVRDKVVGNFLTNLLYYSTDGLIKVENKRYRATSDHLTGNHSPAHTETTFTPITQNDYENERNMGSCGGEENLETSDVFYFERKHEQKDEGGECVDGITTLPDENTFNRHYVNAQEACCIYQTYIQLNKVEDIGMTIGEKIGFFKGSYKKGTIQATKEFDRDYLESLEQHELTTLIINTLDNLSNAK